MTKPAPSYSNPDPHAVAIVGLSLCAPGAAGGLDTKEFHEFLKNRGSGIIRVPSYRWNADAYHGTAPGKACSVNGGFIPNFEYADVQEFGITAAEAGQANTSQFILLHQVFNALQRSGIDYRATNTGVFVGCSCGFTPYDIDVTQAGPYFMTGTALSITANRINYVFDLLGPSTVVDTACSATLTAMHLAVQAVRNGDCHQAVVAGVNLAASAPDHIAFSQLGVLSPDGISKSFDDDADGYARSDLAGAVVIKRHDLAVKDNDDIHATLVGTALTSCGSLMGSLTTPNPEAQAQSIRRAYQDAGLEPHHADFVELHGTGTVVGDSLEANCAGEVFSRGREGREILIGSVKSNIGHGEISAYMSSLTKIILMLTHKEVLPNGYFKKPSKKIHFEKYKLRVPINTEGFIPQDPQRGLIASISSFGFGGACGHTVLREHEKRPIRTIPGFGAAKGPYLFTMGALTQKSCNTLLREYKAIHCETDPLILCEHLGRRTRQMLNRTYAVANSFQLATFPDPVPVGKRPNPLVFCFSGQGPQHWNQGRQLMAAYPAFRDSILACDQAYNAYVGESFLDKTGLFSSNITKSSPLEKSLIWPVETISVSIAMFQIAMFDLLVSLGIQPTAIVGHSAGETAVLYASGAASREMAVKVAVARGRALGMADNKGGSMVAVSGCDADAVRDYVDAVSALNQEGDDNNQLYLSIFNTPSDTGVSGSEGLLQAFAEYINRWVDGATARKLRVNTAVHSPFIAPCEESYRQELHTIFSQHPGDYLPSIPVISTVTGEVVSEPYTIDYLWKSIRQPVLFSTAISMIVERYGELTTFVEISPHPVLSQYIKSMGAHDSIGTGYRPPSSKHLKGDASARTEVHAILDTIGRLLLFGVNSIDFSLLNGYPSETLPDVDYPFNKKLWLYANATAPPASYQRWLLPPTRSLNSTRLRVSPSNPESWMAEHIVDRSMLVPAAAYVEMILEFPGVTEVWDCRFEAVCTLDESVPPSTLEISKDGIDWFIRSSTALENTRGDFEWAREGSPPFDVVHSRGKLSYEMPKLGLNSITHVDKDELLKRLPWYSTKEDLYKKLGSCSQFGPQFRRIERFYMSENEILAWVRGYDEVTNKTNYNIHPAILDAVFQMPLTWAVLNKDLNDKSVYLPHSLRRAFRNDGEPEPLPLPEEFCAYAVLVEWAPTHWVVDGYILDEDGTVIFTIEGLRFARVKQEDALPATRFTDCWQPHALPVAQKGFPFSVKTYTLESDVIDLLKALDELAVSYTKVMLASLPKDWAPETPASRHYLACCKDLIVGIDSEIPGSSDEFIPARFKNILQSTHTVGQNQKDLLVSSESALNLLSQDDVINRVYDGQILVDTVLSGFVTQFLEVINTAIVAGKRVIRVLEIGARQGYLTKLLGQKLVDTSFKPGYYVDYVCSDMDLRSAQIATSLSPWITTSPAVFDPTVPVEEQTLEPASFDIIVALDTLHKYSNTPDVLANLRYMLVPGGYLAAIQWDATSFAKSAIGAKWINFVFGFEMESLPPFSEWEVTLNSSGYADHIFLAQSSDCVGHIAFISQRSESIADRIPSAISKDNHPTDLTIVRHFSAGDEPALVAFLSDLSLTEPYSIWLHTDTTPSNAALVGLSRSLSNEFIDWKMSTVLFHPSWDTSRQREFIYEQLIPLKLVRAELKIDELGALSVPRVIEAPAYPTTEPRGSKAVQFDDTKVWRHYPPILHEKDVEVAVSFTSISPLFTGCSEFSGVVTAAGKLLEEDDNLIGKRVAGIVSGRNGNVIVCPRSRVAVIPDDLSLSMAAALVGRLAFISSVLKTIPSMGRHVVLHAGDYSAAALTTFVFLKASGFEILVTSTQSPDSCWEKGIFEATPIYPSNDYRNWATAVRKFAPRGIDLAISFDSDPSVGVETTRVLAADGTFVQVGTNLLKQLSRRQRYVSVDYTSLAEETDLQRLEDVPTAIRNSLSPRVEIFDLSQLSTAYEKVLSNPLNTSVLLSLEHIDPELPITRPGLIRETVYFNPYATYVLIGGVGGLGICLASFMVDNGARHIVVTSRSGAKSLEDISFIREKNIVQYLRGLPDVTVDIVSLDCLDVAGTKELFASMKHPVAGVFFLPARLNDKSFVNLKTEEDWNTGNLSFTDLIRLEDTETPIQVYDVKIKGLQVLLEAVDPASLDFLVVTSTTAILSGNAGQTNYTAAQYQLAAMVDGLPNTVCVAVPPVLDFGILARSMDSLAGAGVTAFEKLKAFGVSSRQVVQQCMDAILSLGTKPTNSLYIPPMDYKSILDFGSANTAALIRHLVAKSEADSIVKGTTYEGTIRAACAKVLSIPVDEIEETVPLSGYGLDSLTAARLKGTLKAEFNMEVTQLQLLSTYMTVEKLLAMETEQAEAAQQAQNSIIEPDVLATDEASMENVMNETIVPLNDAREGQPAFFVHGAGGGVLVLRKIMQKVKVPVYGIQDTPEAPLTGNILGLSAFYLEKIRQKQKTGPYRIGGFSFGTAVAFFIAQMLHAAGETVEMFIMLDGAPMLYRLPEMQEYLRRTIKDGTISEDIVSLIEDMATSGSLDDAEDVLLQFKEHFKAGSRGSKWVARFCQAYVAHVLMGIRESAEMSRREQEGEDVLAWSVKRTVLMKAEDGTKTSPRTHGASNAWDMDKVTDKVEIYEFPGTHFGFLNPKSGVGEALNDLLLEIPGPI